MIIPDQIVRSSRRSLSLTILKNGEVVVKAPLKMRDGDIEKFVLSKQRWLQNKLNAISNNLTRFDDIISYKRILLNGNKFDIVLMPVKKVSFSNNVIAFPDRIEPEKRIKFLKNWLKKFANSVLEPRIEMLAKEYGLKFNDFKITDTKGRWGSCNSKKLICINFRVAMLPQDIIDYVLTHELCHLIEMNHSREFWNNVLGYYPKAKSARIALKDYGFLLDLYR
ncbi:MAG: M48 family metallopeptidase [Clostridia bacterium]|nr:M48 family metallopeptidase [Clostridia bacterium]